MLVVVGLVLLPLAAVLLLMIYISRQPNAEMVSRLKESLLRRRTVFIGWPLEAPEGWRLVRSMDDTTIETNDGARYPLGRLRAFIAADRKGLVVDWCRPIEPLPHGLSLPAEYVQSKCTLAPPPKGPVLEKRVPEQPPREPAGDAIDPWAVLGLESGASIDAVKKAFLTATKKWHPSRFATESEDEQKRVNEIFLRIKQAHDTLTDPEKRAAYERGGTSEPTRS